jgi:4-hydroxy-2-oxoheptanedioate aldolase
MGDDMAESKQKPRMSFINIIPSPVVTQALASAGADAVVIDQEHAPVGPESLHAMIASTAGTKCLPFVRVTKRDEAMVKLALDFGAAGVVFPLVNSAAEAADCVAMTKYPPHGRRGFGPFIAHSRWAVPFEEYFSRIGDTARCNILIESRAAIISTSLCPSNSKAFPSSGSATKRRVGISPGKSRRQKLSTEAGESWSCIDS